MILAFNNIIKVVGIGNETKKRYDDAIDSFVERVKSDPNVIAVIVAGSVTQGHVWEKSDIDMTVVVRDQRVCK